MKCFCILLVVGLSLTSLRASCDIISKGAELTPLQNLLLADITKHEKCFRYYRELVEQSVFEGAPLRESELLWAIDQMMEHSNKQVGLRLELYDEGLSYEVSIAIARGSNTYHETWINIPDSKNVVHWEATNSSCVSDI